MTVPGIGSMISMTMVVVIGDSEAFDCRRNLAAWVGPAPSPCSNAG
ncbi:transposase [uncultured Tateyamaria sp.]